MQYSKDKGTLKRVEVVQREDRTGSKNASTKRKDAENSDDSAAEGGGVPSGDNYGTSEPKKRRANPTVPALKIAKSLTFDSSGSEEESEGLSVDTAVLALRCKKKDKVRRGLKRDGCLPDVCCLTGVSL